MRFILLFLLCSLHWQLFAQEQLLKSPSEFLPYALGTRFTPHHLMVSYYEYLAEVRPNQVRIERMGYTAEYKPQILVIIGRQDHMADLEQIRKANLQRTKEGKSDKFKDIALVWLGMSVHGNEPAGSESGMLVAYKLLSDDRASSYLANTIVLIDPSQNPDGYNRYTAWNNEVSHNTTDVNRSGREHSEPWPFGRVNHYYFDLNRDWAWQTQIETRNKISKYQQWMPHVLADMHEMGINEPYYFPPAVQPYHEKVTVWQSEFQVTLGKNHAKHFDPKGWLYYTREVFDLFYPSYGDTWPTFNGAIGMTYEQGGIGGGVAVKMANGDTLTLKDRIEHHTTAALSTVEISGLNAAKLVSNFETFYAESLRGDKAKFKTYVLRFTDGNKRDAMLDMLRRNGIQYEWANQKLSGLSGYDYTKGSNGSFDLDYSDILVQTAQSASVMAQVLLNPDAPLSDSLTYDLTAWSLPYSYGIQAWACTNKIEPKFSKPLDMLVSDQSADENNYYAYFVQPGSVNQGRFIQEAQRLGLRVSYNGVATTLDSITYPPGTAMILRGENRSFGTNLTQAVTKASELAGVSFTTVFSGYSDKGVDLGSDWISPIKKRNVAVCFGDDVDNNSYGAVWCFLEKELRQPFAALNTENLKRADLSQYTTLVFPEADGEYSLDSATLAVISAWVRGGGHLMLLGSANTSFADRDGFALKFKERQAEASATPLHHPHFCDAQRESASYNIPGAIVETAIDSTHPVMGGIQRYYTLKTSATSYDFSSSANVVRIEDKPLVKGFVGYKVRNAIENTPVLAIQSMGRGSVAYFVDSPLFRNCWYQGKVLFTNVLYKM